MRRRVALTLIVAVAITLANTSALAVDQFPPDRWLAETRHLESADGRKLFGDKRHGVYRSLGPYQIQERAWYAFGGPRPWRIHAHHEDDARAVAARILRACARKCIRDHRAVTFREVRRDYRSGGY
jgi:hypothetical protein